ncbi:unnamed protein product [Gemmata massiliana]|uniref:Uncharacterized protein n=1 Tax=Gemmata massiliana TaxID=1210884 RepID=A0A6P2CZS5_9BACT|nr:hypothetical protein [Gemmata massiliana]VTR93304.1 unnamed protein product [Gemmata massiliana]
MAQRVFELVSPFPPEECETRLREAVVRPGVFAGLDARPVLGTVENRRVSLCKKEWRNNGFRPFLRGRLEPHADGAVLRCRTGLHPFTRLWLVLFLVLGAFVALVGVANISRALAADRPVDLRMLGPCGLLAFGLAIWLAGRYRARGEGQFLVTFAAEVLGAEPRELEPESLLTTLRQWSPPPYPRPRGEPDDGHPEWVPSFPVLLVVGAVGVVFVACAGLPILTVLLG